MAVGRYCFSEILPFAAMMVAECTNVVLNTLFKAASGAGMSSYVFVVYSYALSNLLLFPFFLISRRRTGLPPPNFSVLYKICFLGVIGSVAMMLAYEGIAYSSPTLSSVISNLRPAFTFILAIIFRLEKSDLRSSSTQAKIVGTMVSLAGALVVTFYKGPAVILNSTPSSSSSISLQWPLGSSQQSNWILGSLLTAVESMLFSLWYIVQTKILKEYPAELVVMFYYNLFATVVSAALGLVGERDLSAWGLNNGIEMATMIYSGLFGSTFALVIHTWGLHLKGPVYVVSFRPLSVGIAAAMGVLFLGDSLFLGSVVGALIISSGFYAVMWGEAKERKGEYCGVDRPETSSAEKMPLLQSTKVEDV